MINSEYQVRPDTQEAIAYSIIFLLKRGMGFIPYLRLGQLYCNACLKEGEAYPNLYYMENTTEVDSVIYNHLLLDDVEELKRKEKVLSDYIYQYGNHGSNKSSST